MADENDGAVPAVIRRSDDTEVRERLIRFVKTHYAKTLGKDIELLDQPGGLELLHRKYCGSNR
jgi:hypothetical protein